MKRGLTLLEMICVTMISAVLMALISPAASRVMFESRVKSSCSNLQQLYVATMIYESDWGGGGVFGDIDVMGLPEAGSEHFAENISPSKTLNFRSPCGLNPSWVGDGQDALFHYIYRPGRGGPEFAEVARKYESNLLLFYDVNCDDHVIPTANPLFVHRGIGILYNGKVIDKRAVGPMYFDDRWWTKPPQGD